MNLLFLLFGAGFGFALSRALATDYDTIIAMFRLANPHLMIVMGTAIVVGAIGLRMVRRRPQSLLGCEIDLRPKPMHKGVIPGGLLFGAGWALSGGCPGTVLAQIGELKTYAVFTAIGITIGTLLYGATGSRRAATAVPAPSPVSK